MYFSKYLGGMTALVLLVLASCANPLADSVIPSAPSASEARGLSSPVGLLTASSSVLGRNLGGFLQYDYNFTGKIIVQNIAYQKQVQVHYSVNGGPWLDLSAAFDKSRPSNHEEWIFSVTLGTTPAESSHEALNVRFAVKYQVGGQTYWDNNGGKDYFVTVGHNGSTNKLYETTLLGRDFPVSLYSSIWDFAIPQNRTWRTVVQTRNFGVQQSVKIRYTLDYWKSYQDLPLEKMYDFTLGTGSYWKSTLNIPFPTVVGYAVCLTVDGVEYWDNNFGSNYHLLFNK